MDWGCGGRCFSRREASVASHLFAIESSEEDSRTVPLMSTSSNLAATRAAKLSSEQLLLRGCLHGGCAGGFDSSLTCKITCEARFL